MSDFDDDFESQRGDEAETSQPKQRTDATEAEREKLLCEWIDKFKAIQFDGERLALRTWKATHIREMIELTIPNSAACGNMSFTSSRLPAVLSKPAIKL